MKKIKNDFMDVISSFGIEKFSTNDFIERFQQLKNEQYADVIGKYGPGGKGSGNYYSSNTWFSQQLNLLSKNGYLAKLSYGNAPKHYGSPVIRYWSAANNVPIVSDVVIKRKNDSEEEHMSLITSYEQALSAAKNFQTIGERPDSIAFNNLSKYFHWYYFEEIHGFAPSKFIGYAGTTVDNYASMGTGTDTVHTLDKLFIKVPRPSQYYDLLAERLSDWLNELGKNVSKKTIDGTGGIYVRRVSDESNGPSIETKSKTEYFEGNPVEVRQTRYERDPRARKECLKHHGYSCKACFINFEQRYGKIGQDYIHVHHIEPLSLSGTGRKINPITDLIPLCPNCHAMIHKLPAPQTLEALKRLLN